MTVAITYDNQALEGFRSGWGFSCLVNGRILFDTGEDPAPLLHNLERMGVSSDTIETVVISHDHWDHTGGLWGVLGRRQGLRVYGCPGFGTEFKSKVRQLGGRLIEADSPVEIQSGVCVTGEIPGEYNGSFMPEQALTVTGEGGVVVITGSSHPGIVNMVKAARRVFPEDRLSMVLGGFHLLDKDRREIESVVEALKDMGVERVGPTHCSGDEARMLFEESFGDTFLPLMAGKTIEIP
jgi:7,8-dihydropterin-6-yl-methyl-4-(beta-D-ribofuranosyl)aminobenzene 5'-phosphate synthase